MVHHFQDDVFTCSWFKNLLWPMKHHRWNYKTLFRKSWRPCMLNLPRPHGYLVDFFKQKSSQNKLTWIQQYCYLIQSCTCQGRTCSCQRTTWLSRRTWTSAVSAGRSPSVLAMYTKQVRHDACFQIPVWGMACLPEASWPKGQMDTTSQGMGKNQEGRVIKTMLWAGCIPFQ